MFRLPRMTTWVASCGLILVTGMTGCSSKDVANILAPEQVATDRSTVTVAVGQEFEITAWIEVQGVGAGEGNRVSALPSAGVEALGWTPTPENRRRFRFRATRTGSWFLEFDAVDVDPVTVRVEVVEPTLTVSGTTVMLPDETGALTATLTGTDGCAIAGGGSRIEIERTGTTVAETGTSSSDAPAAGACPGALDALFDVALAYEADGITRFTFSDSETPSLEPVDHDVRAWGSIAPADFDGLVALVTWDPSSPNNNCAADLLPSMAEGVAVSFASGAVGFAWPIGTVSFGSPVPGILFSAGPRELQPDGTYRAIGFDYQYGLERVGSASGSSLGSSAAAQADGGVRVVGTGSGNVAFWDAPTGGNRLCASFYRSTFEAPVN